MGTGRHRTLAFGRASIKGGGETFGGVGKGKRGEGLCLFGGGLVGSGVFEVTISQQHRNV